jgi:hypothetical protein
MRFSGRHLIWISAALMGFGLTLGAGGCQSAKTFSGVIPDVPKFSCERFARWTKSASQDKKFREQVAADPFPHASQLGVASIARDAGNSRAR